MMAILYLMDAPRNNRYRNSIALLSYTTFKDKTNRHSFPKDYILQNVWCYFCLVCLFNMHLQG